MKPWARKFYQSKAWKQCRKAYIAKVHGLCERCGGPGYIVHHKVVLNPRNINDPNITLNHNLLEYLCLVDHNKEHYGSGITADGLEFDASGNLVPREMRETL